MTTDPTSPISPLGFGTYRWAATPDHIDALETALDLGCTLIDAAPNYAPVGVRAQLGRILAPHRAGLHVISKGGYTDDGGYSLDPAFIRRRIQMEAELIGGGYLDTFLLHNPEHLLSTCGTSQAMDAIAAALAVCTEQAEAGTIRSFGISSNTVATPSHPLGQVVIDSYAHLASELGADSIFKYLQFPYNLVECSALSNRWLERCRALGLTTIGNRPLSPITSNGPARIADRPPQAARSSGELLLELQSHQHGLDWLVHHWDDVASSDALDYVELQASGALQCSESLAVAQIVRDLFATKRIELRHLASLQTVELLKSQESHMELDGNTGDPVAVRACHTYLRQVDHVLVGFRRSSDVEPFRDLFQCRP